jgi:hypothetical protein
MCSRSQDLFKPIASERNFSENKLVSMALFISSNIHQGDDIFSVHSRGKQSAFMTLSAILTAHNMPSTEWSKQTFDNVLIQGDNMYLKALNSGLLIIDDGVEVLSVDDLLTVVDVSFCRNMSNDFPYEICRSLIDHTINTSPSMVINNDLPIIELPVEAQNTIELPVEAQNTIELPVEAQNTIELPVEA